MCINLFTNSVGIENEVVFILYECRTYNVGPILLVLYLLKQLNLDYIYNSKCIVQDTNKLFIFVCISKVMVLYIFDRNFKETLFYFKN